MKHINLISLLCLMLILNSCGLLDSGGGNPDWQYHNIDRIYSINSDGTGLKLIIDGNNFSLLPNGKIIYLNNYILYSCNSDGTDILQLTPSGITVYNYQFYLNGTKIILNNYAALYLMNLDGSGFGQFNLPNNISSNSGFVYSPDGHKLAFTSKTGLYLANEDGSNQILIHDTTNRSYFYNIGFTPDGNNVVYIQDIQGGVALDLRLYNLTSKLDTSLFYSTNGNNISTYKISPWNKLLFDDGDGVSLLDLETYKYLIIYHKVGDSHFSYDSTKITFINFNLNDIGVIDLKQNTTNLLPINLPKNSIDSPLLTKDEKRIIFHADTSWQTLKKSP